MNEGLTNDQSLLTEGEDQSFDKGDLRSGSREGVYVREDWDLESGTLTSLTLALQARGTQ